MLARQRRRDSLGEKPHPRQPAAEASLHELQAILHEEVSRLPEKFRAVFVLCCLEGHSKSEAARELGCKEGTASSRLVKARMILQRRLTRRGVTLSAALTALALGPEVSAAMPATWVASTLYALRAGAGPVAPGTVGAPAGAAAIAHGVLRKGALSTLQWIAGIVLAAGLAAAGAGALMRAGPQGPTLSGRGPAAPARARGPGRTDAYGDPLPPGAVARLGTVRFRHGAGTGALAYSKDGRVLASAGRGRGLCLWDVATGKLRHELVAAESVADVAFSPDGKRVAAGTSAGGLRVWDVATGALVRRLHDKDARVADTVVAFSPDGALLASAGSGKRVTLWDAAAGQPLRRLRGPEEAISCVAFSPAGRLVAAAAGKEIHLWDTFTGTSAGVLSGHDKDVIRVAFSPDGERLASGGEDETVRLWDVAAGKAFRVLEAPGSLVMAVAFAPDGRTLASGHCDGAVRLWEAATGQALRRLEACALPVDSLAFAPDGATLVTGGFWHSALRLWDPATGRERRPFAGPSGTAHRLAFAADGRSLLVGSQDHTLRRWDWVRGTETTLFSWPWGFVEDALALTPHGPVVAGFNWQQSALRVWDAAAAAEPRLLAENIEAMSVLALAPDGRLLLGASGERRGKFGAFGAGYRTIHVWDIHAGKEVRRLDGFEDDVRALAFSPDGTLFISGHGGGDKLAGRGLRLWDAGTFSELHAFDAPEAVDLVAFSPDGRLLAGAKKGDAERPPRLWHTATGKECPIPIEVGRCTVLQFSPDGRLLAVGTGEPESAVVLIDLGSGREVRRLRGHHSGVSAIAFSPDGQFLATGGGDSTVLLWDLGERL
jgi:WD40 repeat protein